MAVLALEKARSRREPNLGCRSVMRCFAKKAGTSAVEWADAFSDLLAQSL
jgi:hypothetical protein